MHGLVPNRGCLAVVDFKTYLVYVLSYFFKDSVQLDFPKHMNFDYTILLAWWSELRFPVLPWEFSLAGEDPHGDHGLGRV
jgi:hypothetical protein